MAAFSVVRHGPGEEIGRTEEHRDALVPRGLRPVPMRVARCSDRTLDVLAATALDIREHVTVAVGHDRLERRAGLDPLAADHHGDVDPLGGDLGEPRLQLGALGRARREAQHRLVHRWGRLEDPVCAHRGRFYAPPSRATGSIVSVVRPESYRYAAEGWGIGEVWTSGERLVLHELARPWPDRSDPDELQQERHREQPARPAGETHPRHGGASTPGVTVPGEVSR